MTLRIRLDRIVGRFDEDRERERDREAVSIYIQQKDMTPWMRDTSYPPTNNIA